MALSGCGIKRGPTARRDEHRKLGAFHTHFRYSLQRRRKRGSHAICHQAEAHHTCTLFWVKGSGTCLTTCKLHNVSLHPPIIMCVTRIYILSVFCCHSRRRRINRIAVILHARARRNILDAVYVYVKGMGYELERKRIEMTPI